MNSSSFVLLQVEGADSLDKIHEVNEKNKKSLQECEKEILDNFTKCDVEEVKKAVIKMKYYDSLSSRINNLMRERGIVSQCE